MTVKRNLKFEDARKDACARAALKNIAAGADPRQLYQAQGHNSYTAKVLLEYGVRKGLFTQEEVSEAIGQGKEKVRRDETATAWYTALNETLEKDLKNRWPKAFRTHNVP